MTKHFRPLLIGALALSATGCDSFVQNIEDPIDTVDEARLNREDQLPYLITGVLQRFATTYGQLTTLTGGLSDELIFDRRVPNATFPTFNEIDRGDIQLDNNSVDGALTDLGQLRFLADNLADRLKVINAEQPEVNDPAVRANAGFTAYLMGGVARYFYGAYFGLEPARGGGTINNGPFIPSDQLYTLAIGKLDTALTYAATGSYEARLANTMRAKVFVAAGRYAQAGAAAAAGLRSGDAPFLSRYSTESTNFFYSNAGRGRTQFAVAPAYVQRSQAGETRIPIESVNRQGTPTGFFRQTKFGAQESPIRLASWQENELIRAEAELRAGNAVGATARVNAVRAAASLAPIATLTLATIEQERQAELFGEGIRLIDQRRFGTFHLGAGAWQFLPLTQGERNANPNI